MGMEKETKINIKGLKLNHKFNIIIVGLLLILITAFTVFFFQNMEKIEIKSQKSDMEYVLDSTYSEMLKQIEAINMSSQFFVSDKKLIEYLKKVKTNTAVDAEALMDFYTEDVASLERLVNNSPNLYQVRLYVDSDTMQEMMPILFRKERMEKLAWAGDEEITGWKFDYTDTIFDSFVMNQNQKIMSLVMKVSDYTYGDLGVLEVAMPMRTMFPTLYDDNMDVWSCFIDGQGKRYCSETEEKKGLEETYFGLLSEQSLLGSGERRVEYVNWDGQAMIIGYMPVKELSGELICIRNFNDTIGQIHKSRNYFILAAVLALIVLVLLVNGITRLLLKQFYAILNSIREIQNGDLNVVVPEDGNDEMGELGSQINKMLVTIRRLMDENIRREVLVKDSEIRALQNQINAHFIYNVLESIKMMAEIDEKYEISDAITALGKLLRYSMKWSSGNVTIEEEVEYIRNYLTLINLRFDYEIYLSLNIPDILYKQRIPKMSLQPIVENAIYHGIEQMAEDTNIYMKGIIVGEDCIIEITDAGKGMSEEELETLRKKIAGETESSSNSGNGIGLKNVQDRIHMCFGTEYGIEIVSKLGCYTKVILKIPMQVKEE